MIISKNRGGGQIAIELILLSTVVVILVTGLISLAALFLKSSVREGSKLQAFTIAESGIEYYRWHLAHAPQDFQDGTGRPGPYVHNYYDKNGNLIGTFTLNITPPPSGSTIVTIQSRGAVTADSSVVKIIKVQYGKTSFVKYSAAVNDNVRFGTGTEVFGPIFSNGGIHFDGLAHNIVQSALQTYNDPDHGGGAEWAVHTHISPLDPLPPTALPSRPDVFMVGRNVGVPALDFTNIAKNLAAIKLQAQASSTYYGSSTALGYDLVLATSGIYSLYKVTAFALPPNGCTNTSAQSGWGTWSIKSETIVATGTIPDNGTIFTEDDLWVRGQINKKHVTIAAGRFPENASTWANISVNSSTLYTNYDGSDTIGLIAQNNFNVGLFSEDVLRIDAALLAENGRVGRYYYAPPNLSSHSKKCGDTVIRQKITLYGSIISNQRYGFGYTDGTGYLERVIIYDSNLLYGSPPNFPLTTDQYSLISWNEIQ